LLGSGFQQRTFPFFWVLELSSLTRKEYPQSCYLTTAVVLSPVYTAVAWQWIYKSQYLSGTLRIGEGMHNLSSNHFFATFNKYDLIDMEFNSYDELP
jgi:hypothetical protein